MKKRDNILRLKYRLEPKENNMVEFQILQQDEKLTNKSMDNVKRLYYDESIDLAVESEGVPEIMDNYICLRGYLRDLDYLTNVFEGHHLIPSIHKALEEMVKKVFGNCKVVKG